MVTPSGFPILVECKLWRNPQGRREVVAQILDYAKELSRWTSADLQREVRRCLKSEADPLLDLVRSRYPAVDEIQFNDALSLNLRRGRLLLLIVGDGIREGVEAIAEYLNRHMGLHFSFGLVELPIFETKQKDWLVIPRVVAQTTLITRTVVALQDGYGVEEADDASPQTDVNPEHTARAGERQRFWTEFLQGLQLDDPEQPKPRPARIGYISFTMPAPSGSCWLIVFYDKNRGDVGVYLSSNRNGPGEAALNVIADDWAEVKQELGGTAKLVSKDGRRLIVDSKHVGILADAGDREDAFAWLRERVNTFVNVMRPRVRSAVADLGEHA